MYKVSIIGGSGFVGTNLCRSLLKNGIDFEILDIKESIQFPEKFKHADVREKESLRSALSGDIVVNLAAVLEMMYVIFWIIKKQISKVQKISQQCVPKK